MASNKGSNAFKTEASFASGSAKKGVSSLFSGCWPRKKVENSIGVDDESPPLDFHVSDSPIEDLYSIEKEIGRGSYGVVHAGFRKSDNLPFAFKYVHGYSLAKEFALLLVLRGSPGVIHMEDYRKGPGYELLVLERPVCSMDLQKFVLKNVRLDESIARIIFKQVAEAVFRCFQRKVLHRDIKCENILLDVDKLEAKLIDFGSGCIIDDDCSVSYNRDAGTPAFNPPEWFLSGTFLAESGTVWSLGIVLYMMVCGKYPFQNVDDILGRKPELCDSISNPCKELIRKCFKKTERRITLRKILKHSWLNC